MYVPTHDYWPLGGWIEYQAFSIGGYFHPDTFELDVYDAVALTAAQYPDDYYIRKTFIPITDGPVPDFAIVYTHKDEVPPVDWKTSKRSLIQGMATHICGAGVIGEIGTYSDFGNHDLSSLALTPDPELPVDITDTTVYTGHIEGVYYNKLTGATTSSSLDWRFKNLGLGKGPGNTYWWPEYPNQLRTYLEERYDTNTAANTGDTVYNQLYAKGVGPVNIWWGTRGPDNHLLPGTGWMWQIRRMGK